MREYTLTLKEMVKLCRDFSADCHDGFVSNDEAYIESQLKDKKSYYGKEIAMKFYDWTNTTHIDRLTHTEELFNMFLKDEL